MPVVAADTPLVEEGKVLKAFWIGTAVACVLAGVLFAILPGLDLAASRAFFDGSKHFVGDRLAWVEVLRWGFVWLFWGCFALSIWGLTAAAINKRSWLRLAAPQWLFLLICLCVGPGLVANTLLKDQWGRARPREVIEFGGQRTFTPPLVPANQCARNCSFVSGEASSAFVPFYAAALAVPQWAAALIAAGTLAGLSAGAIRISQGAHFLSDIVFAGVFMALTAVLVHQIMFAWSWPRSLLGLWRPARRRAG